MLRRILVIQLLTILLDPSGVDSTSLAEAFPDDYTPDLDDSGDLDESALTHRDTSILWKGASPALSEALHFLVDQQLVTVEADGRVVAAPVLHDDAFSPTERDEGFGIRPLFEWDGPRFHELAEPFAFDQVRLEA